jgi:hypothetical protein
MILYLDLAHWINLAKARVGHSDGRRYAAAYVALQRLTSVGAVQTPFSAAHYAEIQARISNVRQRNDIALTMAELSQYTTLISRERRLRFEFRTALASALGLSVPAAPAPASVGYGVGHAFGHPFHGRLVGPGSDTFEPGDRVYKVIDDLEKWVGGGWHFSRRDVIENGRELLMEAFNEVTEFSFCGAQPPPRSKSFGAWATDPKRRPPW